VASPTTHPDPLFHPTTARSTKGTIVTTSPALAAPILTLLDQAERECSSRAKQSRHSLDDLSIWQFDAQLTRIASDTLRCALGPRPTEPTESIEPTDPTEPSDGVLDPLGLVESAYQRLLELPEDLDNVQLLLARLRTSDAVSAIRTHYV